MLSFSQLMALLFGALFSPAAELLPGGAAQAGGMGALGILGGAAVMALAGLLAGALLRPGVGLERSLVEVFGRTLGRGILLLYIIWFQMLFTLRLRLCAQRLLGGGVRDGAVWFFLLVLGGMALWMARGHLDALGRTAQLLFTALWVTAGAVLLLSLAQVRSGNLLPDGSAGISQLLCPGGCALGYGLFAIFLYQKEEKTERRLHWLGWMAGGALALLMGQLVIVGRFGPALTLRLEQPFFQLAKSVGIEGAFQRVESLVTAIWVFSDLLLLAGLLWGMRRIWAVLCPKWPSAALAAISVLIAEVIALAVFGGEDSPGKIQEELVPLGSAVLALVIPGLAIFIKEYRRGR